MTKHITLLSLGHGCVDVYQGAVAALVPYFVAERGYDYAAASGIVLAASLLSSVVQPLFGTFTDRWAVPWLLPVATLAAGIGVGLAGVTHDYPVALAVVAVSGVGVAAYHPEAARVARHASRGSHTAMSWFSLGGNIGFAAAPIVVGAVVGTRGLGASPLLVIPAAVGALLCVVALRTIRGRATAGGAVATGTDDWASFVRLTGAVVCRSVVFVGLGAFISLYARQRVGGGDVAGTAALFVLYLGGAVGTVAGGRLAARYGRLAVVRWSYGLTTLAVAGVVLVPGPALYVSRSRQPACTCRSHCTSRSARTTCRAGSAPRAASRWAWPSASAAWPAHSSAHWPTPRRCVSRCCRWSGFRCVGWCWCVRCVSRHGWRRPLVDSGCVSFRWR